MARSTTLKPRLKIAAGDVFQVSRAGGHLDGRKARDPYKLERRSENREPASGSVLASYQSPGRFGITTVNLADRSSGGIGLNSDIAIEPGMRITLACDGALTPWLSGTVARCDQRGKTFHVGIRLNKRSLAA